MHFPGDSTWTISSGDDGTFALFVREAFGISTPTADSIPRLTRPVPPLSGVEPPPDLARIWDQWWAEASSRGYGGEPFDSIHELREAYHRWQDPRSPEHRRVQHEVNSTFSLLVHEVITEIELELGYKPVFRLAVVQLPVVGQFWRRVKRDRVLVSEELMVSRNVLAPLESVLRELVQ